VDQKILDQAMAAERRLKRLRMAKFSTDLFDEIVEEMMKEKRTPMEMMAELDVDEQALLDAQDRIARKRQRIKVQSIGTEGGKKEEKAAGKGEKSKANPSD